MSELLTSGVPKDLAAVQDWNAFNVKVVPDTNYGFIFDMQATGYMSQFMPIGTVINAVTVTIEYKNSGSAIQGTLAIYEADSKNVATKFVMFTTEGYETLTFNVPTDGTKVSQVAFEIINDSDTAVQIASMSLDGALVTQAGSIDTSDFIQSSIMFGLDAAKPDLG